jgi:penicillin-insensitive murein endopeptidase
MIRLPVALAAALIATAASAAPPGNAWSVVPGPTREAAAAIGGYAHGCLAGAASLPPKGTGYEAIRLFRKRNYGHPELVRFIADLGRSAAGAGLPTFMVGDMSLPRGGPLPYGHASHQIGLDADIWFTFDPPPGQWSGIGDEAELPSMLLAGAAGIDRKKFGLNQVQLLRLAASDPRVARIFVSPVIKLALCHGYGGARTGDASWLRRLNPWWGHDDHFHVRLNCPADSPGCEPQPTVPPGDGCDAGLAHWAAHPFPPPSPSPAPVNPPAPHPRLPAACTRVLDEP